MNPCKKEEKVKSRSKFLEVKVFRSKSFRNKKLLTQVMSLQEIFIAECVVAAFITETK